VVDATATSAEVYSRLLEQLAEQQQQLLVELLQQMQRKRLALDLPGLAALASGSCAVAAAPLALLQAFELLESQQPLRTTAGQLAPELLLQLVAAYLGAGRLLQALRLAAAAPGQQLGEQALQLALAAWPRRGVGLRSYAAACEGARQLGSPGLVCQALQLAPWWGLLKRPA
jgi:hypothetical protein